MSVVFEPFASSSAGCAYRLTAGECGPVLLDAGLPYSRLREALGFQVSKLKGCLLTHFHGDHAKSIPDLLRSGVDVYASTESFEALGVSNHYRAHAVTPLKNFEVGGFTVTPFDCQHDAKGTLGFFLRGNGNRILYLTDSAYSKYRFENLTHIYVEANFSEETLRERAKRDPEFFKRFGRIHKSHMSIEKLIDTLKRNDLSSVKEIVLLHLSQDHSEADSFKAQVQRATGVPVFLAMTKGGMR